MEKGITTLYYKCRTHIQGFFPECILTKLKTAIAKKIDGISSLTNLQIVIGVKYGFIMFDLGKYRFLVSLRTYRALLLPE